MATQSDLLVSIFQGLKSKSPETRLQSAQELRHYVRPIYFARIRVYITENLK